VTVLCQSFRSAGRAFTLRLNQFRTKKEYSIALLPAMQSKSTKIAYLKRMLKRLEGEDTRLQNLVSRGELTRPAAELAVQQLNHSRDELLAELRKLEPENPA
jgi:hypothetical protein